MLPLSYLRYIVVSLACSNLLHVTIYRLIHLSIILSILLSIILSILYLSFYLFSYVLFYSYFIVLDFQILFTHYISSYIAKQANIIIMYTFVYFVYFVYQVFLVIMSINYAFVSDLLENLVSLLLKIVNWSNDCHNNRPFGKDKRNLLGF